MISAIGEPFWRRVVAVAATIFASAALNAAPAVASVVTNPNAGGGNSCTYSTTVLSAANATQAGVSAATDCAWSGQSFGPGGNVTLDGMNTNKPFNVMDQWVFDDKIDDPKADPPPQTFFGDFFNITITENKDGDPDDPMAGTWALNNGNVFVPGESYVLALKGGNLGSFIYLLDTQQTFGTWSTKDLNFQGLSNITMLSTIPLPAAAWLMLAGLGGLGLVARRRSQMVA